jgi:ketosteroid isomerase-like protein
MPTVVANLHKRHTWQYPKCHLLINFAAPIYLARSTMQLNIAVVIALSMSLVGCTTPPVSPRQTGAKEQVVATERAFAKSMADRDQEAFARFISTEAIFYAGPTPLHGKAQVVAAWAKFFAGAKAPFSWEPREVEVLESGQLAISSGPVRDAGGKLVATFTSIWRLEAPDTWRIVFDKGDDVCDCARP